MAKKRSNVPSNETPEARFIRIATTKTNAVIRNLRTLSRLNGVKAKSTEAQRIAISKAITESLAEAVSSMAGNKVAAGGFKL